MTSLDKIVPAILVALLGAVVVGFCVVFGHSLLSFL